MVVSAVGQGPVTDFLRVVQGIELRKDGTVVINDRHQTGNPKYFAAGDCANGGKEVVAAVAEGIAAARGPDAWLGYRRGRLQPTMHTSNYRSIVKHPRRFKLSSVGFGP